MELVVEPDIYAPSIDDKGLYIDKVPPFNFIKKGLVCPCGTRKEHVFDTRSSFSGHIKTKTHLKWISDLNTNKMNYFSENVKLNETITNQKIIIAKLQRENNENIMLIAHLTKKIEIRDNPNIIDLISFD